MDGRRGRNLGARAVARAPHGHSARSRLDLARGLPPRPPRLLWADIPTGGAATPAPPTLVLAHTAYRSRGHQETFEDSHHAQRWRRRPWRSRGRSRLTSNYLCSQAAVSLTWQSRRHDEDAVEPSNRNARLALSR